MQDCEGSSISQALYETIGPPPLLNGACQEIFADRSLDKKVTPVGYVGAFNKVSDAEGSDTGESPTLLVALTVNV